MPNVKTPTRKIRLKSFELEAGRKIAGKYEVVEKVGEGWEGEVYKVRESRSGIEHAAKLFYPHRDSNHRAVLAYARKLHKLRHCSMVVRYHTEESLKVKGCSVFALISEFVEGELLSELVVRRPGKRLPPYEALHIIYALARGMSQIHKLGEYHGDLHTDNIIVVRHGLNIDLKLLDMYYWGKPSSTKLRDDVIDIITLLYEITGGKKHYRNQPQPIKHLCRGLKKNLILENFTDAIQLTAYLENLEW